MPHRPYLVIWMVVICTSLAAYVFFHHAGGGAKPVSSLAPVQAVRAHDFIETLGVNTHMGYIQPENAYSHLAVIESQLKYLGFHYARDRITSLNGVSPIPFFAQLNRDLGIKFMLFISGHYNEEMTAIKANRHMIAEIEGANEIDNWPPQHKGLTGFEAGKAMQRQMWQDIKSDASMGGIHVDTLTIAHSEKNNQVGDLSPYTDRCSVHMYQQWGGAGGSFVYPSVQWNMQHACTAKAKPRVITETGWWTLPAEAGVPERVQAKFELIMVFDAFLNDVKRTMLYELSDEVPEPQGKDREKHFGLFRYDGTPKLAATVFHNLTALLADSENVNPPAGELAYDIKTFPPTAHQLLLQKSDGTFIIAIWNEEKFWDNMTHRELQAMPLKTQLDFAKTVKDVWLFDPMVGTDALAHAANVKQFALEAVDHPLLVFVTAK